MEPMKEKRMEFKAGDVVMHPEWGRGLVVRDWGEKEWVWFVTPVAIRQLTDVADDLRGLAAIDPESVEDVERMVNILCSIEYVDLDLNESLTLDGWRLRAALREYVTPTPEPLAEPMDLAARVLDRNGQPWARVGGRWWVSVDDTKEWAELTEDDGPLRLAD